MKPFQQLLSVLIIVYLGSVQCQASVEGCGDWQTYKTYCYKYFGVSKTWMDAEVACQSYGGHLASIADQQENDFIVSLIIHYHVWIGFNDRDNENSFIWMDGSTSQWTNWGEGEPNNAGTRGEHCTEIRGRQSPKWNDNRCSITNKYVCKRYQGNAAVEVTGGTTNREAKCALMKHDQEAFRGEVEDVPMSWYETPSIVEIGTDAKNETLKSMVLSKPELYLDEYQVWFAELTGKSVSVSTLCRAIIRLGFTYKKPSTQFLPSSGHYQVLGRNVHMHYVEEYLRLKKEVEFGDSQETANNIDVTVLADIIYTKGNIKMRGINKLMMFSRKLIFLKDSKLDLRAPALTEDYPTLTAGQHGNEGKNGVNGPTVEIYADKSTGYINIEASGGDGRQAQDGAKGHVGSRANRPSQRNYRDCQNHGTKSGSGRWTRYDCPNVVGANGPNGGTGGNGGNAGRSGVGGNAGRQTIHVNTVDGNIELKSCRGIGGEAADYGEGGDGGHGGDGGYGVKCKQTYRYEIAPGLHGTITFKIGTGCTNDGVWTSGSSGTQGSQGTPGTTSTEALPGAVDSSYLVKRNLDNSAMQRYPLVLIKLMTRLAEDLIWANNLDKAKAVFQFVVTITKERTDALEYRKIAKRRLNNFDKKGLDRFGRSKMLVPLTRWQSFKNRVIGLKDHAKVYEDAYNDIKASLENKKSVREILDALPLSAQEQVRNEKERLIVAKSISITEKNAYVRAIKDLESNMGDYLEVIHAEIPVKHGEAVFTNDDMFAVLGGLTGLFKTVATRNPLELIDPAIATAQHFIARCNSGGLYDLMKNAKRWLTFGKEYQALQDSSELDFDKMDVEQVPEVMQANLAMNKEALTVDLTCMVEQRLQPVKVADLKGFIERFFLAGAARIDLIAKVIDLDNEIGGFNFDIPSLEETQNNLENLRKLGENAPIATNIEEMFLDDLLNSYQILESSFSQQLYWFYKSYEFRSLWDVTDKLLEHERSAAQLNSRTKQLQGVVQLNDALLEIDRIHEKTRNCFNTFTYHTAVHKWPFNTETQAPFFKDLHEGKDAKLKFDISNIGTTSNPRYNVRLLKMYVELYGDNTQSSNGMPDNVHLKLRHEGASYFRGAGGTIREFRQSLKEVDASWRDFKFDRTQITDPQKCKTDPRFCMTEDDRRLERMCCYPVNNLPCTDPFLGTRECQSPFGIYSIKMPIDDEVECDTSNQNINCKDFDRSIYTNMNVWMLYSYYNGYPTGPDDPRCSASNDKATNRTQAISKMSHA